MAKTISQAVDHTKLSEQATQLINELWDILSLIQDRQLTGAEMQRETARENRSMEEYEHFLRQKLLKYRTIWKDSSTKDINPETQFKDGGEGDFSI